MQINRKYDLFDRNYLLHSYWRNDNITFCCLKYRLKEIMRKEEHKTARKTDKTGGRKNGTMDYGTAE